MKRKIIQKRCLKVFLLLIIGILTVSSNSFAQSGTTITIKGNVKDTKGEPVIGASIVVKGTTIGVMTDLDGSFQVNAAPNGTLVVSFIGFNTVEKAIDGKTFIPITLEEDAELLKEVVVIGYGSVKKEDLTGSITTVSANTLAKGLVTTPSDLLIGRAPGVSVINDGGAPGSAARIRIRGGSSLSASNDPLIVIDGVPVDNGTVNGMANPLTAINPNDIESFTVLKDASATAIYGSRASNGVIIITTKKGQSGKPQVSYNGTFGISQRKGEIDVMDANTFRNFVKTIHGENSVQAQALGTADTNWQDQIFQTAFSTDHSISLGGVVNKLPYRASVGYTNESGILKTSNMERWTGAINLSPKFFDDMLSVQVNLKGMYNKNKFADRAAIGAAAEFDPTQPIFAAPEVTYGNGYFMSLDPKTGTPLQLAIANPLAILNQRDDISTVKRSIGNAQIDYKMHFLPELKATLNLGYDVSDGNGSVTIQDNSPMSFTWGNYKAGWGENTRFTQLKRNQLLDFYLNYVKDIKEHRIDVMGGYSWQHFYRSESNLFPYSQARQEETGNEFYRDGNFPRTESYLVSFFGRLNYSFANRYLLTFTLRNDGSSRFGPDHRWGLFPAAALAWKINEESFMKNQKLFSDLKLRLGYGVTGQQELFLGDYPYLARYTFSRPGANYFWGDQKIQLLRPEAYDQELKWEETTTYNIGFDYGFLNNRISGTLDVYYRKTTDLLNEVPIAGGANFSNRLLTNFGDLENRGIEFAITGRPISNKDWNWSLNYNIAYNKNKITKLNLTEGVVGVERGGISGGTGTNILINAIGHTVNSFFVYEQIYDSNGAPIEGAYVDQNKDGVIDSEDKIIYKSGTPPVVMGLTSQLSYKNWDFNFMMHANLGNYAYNNVQSNREAHGPAIMFDPSGFLKNRMNSAPFTNFREPQYQSSYYVQRASFLRMDNISAGYTFNNFSNYISSLRVFATVQNPFVITSYKGLDPEFNNDGIDNNIYPRPIIYMLGVNLNF